MNYKDYITFEDLFQKLGYKSKYKPRFGSVGRAMLEANKNQRSNNILKSYWDSYFNTKREKQRKNNVSKKQNSRYNIHSNATNHTKSSSTNSTSDNGQDSRRKGL